MYFPVHPVSSADCHCRCTYCSGSVALSVGSLHCMCALVDYVKLSKISRIMANRSCCLCMSSIKLWPIILQTRFDWIKLRAFSLHVLATWPKLIGNFRSCAVLFCAVLLDFVEFSRILNSFKLPFWSCISIPPSSINCKMSEPFA